MVKFSCRKLDKIVLNYGLGPLCCIHLQINLTLQIQKNAWVQLLIDSGTPREASAAPVLYVAVSRFSSRLETHVCSFSSGTLF